ncbi:MAG TPA: D-xylose ABC transporter ATP-binding protein [Opitutae bacterium]|nr:D-xylose ABC transporter ATP-binding protein [Opitutaceae bacterium]HCR31525.1 D-xylose ABC transporter ATP-binding protein [Opitutae bacterium]
MSLLQLKRISKSFGPVQALDEVELEVEKGEVLGLIGENGAGKSTLMNILGGMFPPSSGQILLDGSSVAIHDAKAAERLGISFVHQELNLLDNIDIAGNIFLGREPKHFGCIDQRRLHDLSRPLLETLGLPIDPFTSVALLTNGQKQLVEIAKALSMDAKILILDEPTSSLTLQETDTLLRLAQKLRNQGMAIIFISHRLAEIETIADRVIALRDGRNAGGLKREEINRNAMISMMIGRELDEVYPKTKPSAESVILSVKDFSTRQWPNGGATFEIKSGEILGMAGLVGAGRSELAQALFGVDDSPSGFFEVESQSIPRGDVSRCIANGVFLAPEDRKSSGLVLEMSIRENMTLNSMKRFTRYLSIDFASEKENAEVWLREFGIKAPSTELVVGNLSGGNQQKVVLAKWMTLKPKVMIFDEPTRGIDMGAREEIYRSIAKLAETGCAILMISSDMEELLGMSHRIAVMREGSIAGILDKEAFSEEAIMQLAVREDLATSA